MLTEIKNLIQKLEALFDFLFLGRLSRGQMFCWNGKDYFIDFKIEHTIHKIFLIL